MSTPAHQPASAPAAALPGGIRFGAVAIVCTINLAILVYAVSRALPHKAAPAAPLAAAAAPAPGATPPPAPPAASQPAVAAVVNPIALPSADVIKGAYIQHCSACHGAEGRGDGPAAAQLYPRPRDFVTSPFRFASTGGRTEDVLAALQRTIAVGVPRSGMPGFAGVLDEPLIAGLARYVLDQRAATPGGTAADTLDLGTRPPTTPGLIARGAELYTAQGCVTCHGPSGHGDGEQSARLVDSIGRPVRPADLGSGLFKSGQGPADLARTILKGVPGTPMIAYEPVLARANANGTRDLSDAWALVAFIQSLHPREQTIGHTSGAELVAGEARDPDMLDDPAHPAWLGVPATPIELRPLWQRVETITHVDVRVVRTAAELALCLDWRDDTLDQGRDHHTFCDAVSVMFAMGRDVPALPMGVHVEGFQAQAPVNLWHWKASRHGEPGATADAAPHAPGIARPTPTKGWAVFGSPGPEADAQSGPPAADPPRGATGELKAGLPSFLTAHDAGNVHEATLLRTRAALEANAEGFGTLALQPPERQHVRAAALWSNGLWRVVLVRSLNTDDPLDIDLTRGDRIPIAFAVWDGAKGDRDGIKLVSGWHWLRTARPATTAAAEIQKGHP